MRPTVMEQPVSILLIILIFRAEMCARHLGMINEQYSLVIPGRSLEDNCDHNSPENLAA